ncbi:MAG: hypothetical protein A3E81_01990 [Gammaproteobacteria bacterium RIFCSPHIGHO2_12_FULL_36_30]|nr:MAG: hypothetical protein A3E81_01990 [Gammaproteobacteria bacterium RIFCSPHIGHO2_12_FULL_36_30]
MRFVDAAQKYFTENYPSQALSGACAVLTGSTVVFNIIKMSAPDAATATGNFFQKNILGPVFTEDYATLGFPLFNSLIGISVLVLLGNAMDTVTEKTCGLVSKLQNVGYLPKLGDQRVFLFLTFYVYYPTLPFSKSEAAVFIALQLILQTGNNALQLSSETKINDFSLTLKAAYANIAFCALMPVIAKMIFVIAQFIFYFCELIWKDGMKNAINTIKDFPNKYRFMYNYLCLKHLSAEQLVPSIPTHP